MIYIFPDYYKEFQCSKGLCRHNCCIGWEIDIDDNTATAYASLEGPLGDKLRRCVARGEKGCPSHFILGDKERCPFLNEENLCEIILELGDQALCNICADHPRFVNEYDDRIETGLGLCCEAAATLILQKKEPTLLVDDKGLQIKNSCKNDPILTLRDRIIDILQDRQLNISQRLQKMLIASGCAYSLQNLEKSLPRYVKLLKNLERLDDEWTVRLDELDKFFMSSSERELYDFDLYMKNRRTEYEQLAVYFTYRYFALAPELEYVPERAGFAAFSVLLIRAMGAAAFKSNGKFSFSDQVELARLFSSEIEYSEENLYTVMDSL
jgi:lysine-N-methylase